MNANAPTIEQKLRFWLKGEGTLARVVKMNNRWNGNE